MLTNEKRRPLATDGVLNVDHLAGLISGQNSGFTQQTQHLLNTVTLGVDPGISGAWCILDALGRITAIDDLPVVGSDKQRMVSGALLADVVRKYSPTHAVIERVGAMPQQGVSSMFRFGQASGVIMGVISALSVPVSYVAPSVWKAHFKVSTDKESARQRAIEIWPGRADLFARKRDHGRAEAALIALWGLRANIVGGVA